MHGCISLGDARAGGDPAGKLIAAATRWATGRGGSAKADDDALTAGTDLPDRAPAAADEAVELSEDEAQSFALFLSLGTQWNWHPTVGVRLGIRYEAVEPTARMMGLEWGAARFADLKAMEAAALSAKSV